jgi:rRNA maturation RNase YbeY
MIKVYVKKQGNFPVSSVKIKNYLAKFFTEQGIVSDSDVNVAIIGEGEMEILGKKFISPDEPIHNVLSFTGTDSKKVFLDPPDDILHLGDIAVCYPICIDEAKKEGILVEEKVIELIEHGAYHLLGKHHG